jgi:hypothetical protein
MIEKKHLPEKATKTVAMTWPSIRSDTLSATGAGAAVADIAFQKLY